MSDILHLPLRRKWYEMIESGEKKEEYREIKPYWIKRIMKCRKWCGCATVEFTSGRISSTPDLLRCRQKRCENILNFCAISGGFTHVRFSRGYTNTTMMFKIESITIGIGRPEWGAPKGKEVFVIRLGDRIIDKTFFDAQEKRFQEALNGNEDVGENQLKLF